ncbi:hypothetical protein yberc0001_13700 [Yersinia bercovieri ATCC 43970]|uniref:Uncharacterized protein n=1 Tax=Yersinia bercovieri ATCC 43970 TaxID=349968 RepID=A0ABM9Y187_YERBE|nr:hypothetical protein yberc0001_13700 [Yersinia bercovieri ATCC 43970]
MMQIPPVFLSVEGQFRRLAYAIWIMGLTVVTFDTDKPAMFS